MQISVCLRWKARNMRCGVPVGALQLFIVLRAGMRRSPCAGGTPLLGHVLRVLGLQGDLAGTRAAGFPAARGPSAPCS